jgi:hypothetical protein
MSASSASIGRTSSQIRARARREAALAEAAERALEPEPEPPSEPPSQAPPPSNVQYLSTRRQPDGKPPAHYLREDDGDGDVICAKPFTPVGGWR